MSSSPIVKIFYFSPFLQQDRPLAQIYGNRQVMGHDNFCLGMDWIRSISIRLPAGSRLSVGSSRARISESMDNTVARATLFFSPSLRWCADLPSNPFNPDHLQCLSHPLPDVFFIQSHIERTESDIIEDRGAEKLILWVLKDETHPSPNLFQIFFLDRQCPRSSPFLSYQRSVQMIEESRFPGAIWAKDRNGFMSIDLQSMSLKAGVPSG